MKDFLKVYTPIALLIIAGFVITYQFIDPAPPRHLRMAAGAPDVSCAGPGPGDWGKMALFPGLNRC